MNRYPSNKASLRDLLLVAGLGFGLVLGMPAIAAGSAPYADSASSMSATDTVPDSRIAADVQGLLTMSVPKAYTVTAKTDHGVVFLSGELMDQDAVVRLQQRIEKVDGVKSVDTRGLDVPFITVSY